MQKEEIPGVAGLHFLMGRLMERYGVEEAKKLILEALDDVLEAETGGVV